MNGRLLTAALALAGLLQGGVAAAATCSVSVTTPLDFGTYDTVDADAPAAWLFTVSCTRTATGNTVENLSITDTFSTGSGTYAARTMSSGTNVLTYNLYADAAHTEVRGDGTGGTFAGGPVAVTLTKAAPTYSGTGSIYGLIPGNQNVPPGTYMTTTPIVITIQY